MLKGLFLWLSEQKRVFEFVKRKGIARNMALRFVAGETVETAIEAARTLNAKGITASLDLLGESVSSAEETRRARDEVIHTLDEIARTGVQANVSVKLTQLGLDVDDTLCLENMRSILTRARGHGIFVRIDMESSAHTARTLDLFDGLHPEHGSLTGVVIQSYLRRSAEDIERLVDMGARVRLCKGAYAEPPSVAFQKPAEVSRSFVSLMERLLEEGNYPAIATHDDDLIAHAVSYTNKRKIPVERFEFQMLYGVRRDLQQELRNQGYNMRVYVPFGSNWYPYLMRRLAERSGNLRFMAASILKEKFSGR